jgi:DNA-binding SARP family transcriptional activator
MFGGFELRLHGERRQRSGKQQQKPLELLRLMACERTLSVPLRAAADALWPEADGAAARKSLEMTVQRLRRLLEDDTLVRVGDGTVSLDPARASSDVAQRRALIERLEALAMQPAAAAEQRARECALLAVRVVDAGSGLLLPGAPDTPWLEAERLRCEREATRAAKATAAVLERAGTGPAERELLETALREISRR